MKLKLDENLSRHLKHVLIELNLDVMTAAEQGLLSKSDKVVADQDSLASFEGLRRGASARQVADVARHEVPWQSPSSERGLGRTKRSESTNLAGVKRIWRKAGLQCEELQRIGGQTGWVL